MKVCLEVESNEADGDEAEEGIGTVNQSTAVIATTTKKKLH